MAATRSPHGKSSTRSAPATPTRLAKEAGAAHRTPRPKPQPARSNTAKPERRRAKTTKPQPARDDAATRARRKKTATRDPRRAKRAKRILEKKRAKKSAAAAHRKAPLERSARKRSARKRLARVRDAAAERDTTAERDARRPAAGYRVLPVSAENWADFTALFQARGAPHYCWCTVYRLRNSHLLSREERQQSMRHLVHGGTPIGVLAYEGDTPVGWCSIAPRESYVKLERSRTMPRVSNDPTWTVLCFYVQRSHRGSGVARALLAGGLDVARQHGARWVEGYPHDTAGISSTHRGHSRVFRELGFAREGRRWFHELGATNS